MIVLDTNVVSELMRPIPDPWVFTWIDEQRVTDLFLTAITVAEVLYGIARLPKGKRQAALLDKAVQMFEVDFAGQIMPFGSTAAAEYARLLSASEAMGRCIGMADAQIASICSEHGAALATRNVRDFQSFDVTLINPWEQNASL